MAEETREQTTGEIDPQKDPDAAKVDEPLASTNDPGGAHNKGFSADPSPEAGAQDQDPVPLAPGPDTHPAVRVPERDNNVQPTGRSDPSQTKESSANERLL